MSKKTYKLTSEIEEYIKKGPFNPTWESLSKYQISPWFNKSKFGIFIHWGLYSIAEFNNEWYSRNMYIKDTEEYHHHIKTFGPHKEFGYKDFIPMFKAEKFDPKQWAELFKKSGAKYVVPVAEHHEGFQMYESAISKWNSMEMGPKRDIVGELKNAVEEEGLTFATSSHRAEHWWFMSNGRNFESDITDNLVKGDFYWPAMPEGVHYDFRSEPKPNQEFLEDWLERTVEIIDKYEPKMLYFDWWIQHETFKPYVLKLVAYYYNYAHHNNFEATIAYKHDTLLHGTGVVDMERGGFENAQVLPWQTDTSIANNSWCYTNSLDYKEIDELITTLVDVVSKNGNLLLNIGPKGSGEIPEYERDILIQMGQWLNLNGEGIYNTIPFKVSSEGVNNISGGMFAEETVTYTHEDIRFTLGNGYIYAFIMNPKGFDEFNIKRFKTSTQQDQSGTFNEVLSVELLGSSEKVEFKQTSESLNIKLNNKQGNLPIAFKVKLS